MEITAALIREKGGKFELQKIMLDEPRVDEILVKIVATGTCHTDMAVRDQQMGPIGFPFILGHEGAGIVEKVGENVKNLQPGDHVVLTFGSCGECENCKKGKPAYCENLMGMNFSGCRLDGTHNHSSHKKQEEIHDNFFSQSSFATYAISHKSNTIKVDKNAPLEILGPLGCGIQTGAGAIINSLKVKPGKSIVITGAGAVGLSALLAAVACSAGIIVAIDINNDRLDFAKELGATHVINSKMQDVSKELRKILPKGFDYGLDTTGRNEVINMILSALKPFGEIGILGVATKPLEIEMNSFVSRGIKLKGIVEGDSVPSEFIPQMVNMYLLGQFPFDKLIKKYSFQDINQAIEDSESGKTIKPVILIGDFET